MATLINVLSQPDRKAFEIPPVFSEEERVSYFDIPQWASKLIKAFRTPTNKVGFILQLGYFRSANSFFGSKIFHPDDVAFVAKFLKINIKKIYFNDYTRTTYERHQFFILENLGFRKFDDNVKGILEREAVALCAKLLRPRSIFMSLIDFLRSKKIEVPSYHILSDTITNALRSIEEDIQNRVYTSLTPTNRGLLDSLINTSPEYLGDDKRDLKNKRYKITLLKKSNQSTKPSRIRENIDDLLCIKELFDELEPDIKALGISPETIEFYARIAIKPQVFQLARRDKSRYLYLLAFVVHQYYKLNDTVIDALLQSIQSTNNASQREHKEMVFEARADKLLAIKDLADKFSKNIELLKRIDSVVDNKNLSDSEKLREIKSLLRKKEAHARLLNQINAVTNESSKILKDGDYYDILENNSMKLQKRVSPILKAIVFDRSDSDAKIADAIDYFKKRDGIIGQDAPTAFLGDNEPDIIYDEKGKLRVSLYKYLLFHCVAESLKSGTLNLAHSYKYMPFEDYLIPRELWKREKDILLERAGLTGFKNFPEIEQALRKAVDEQFRVTNKNIISGLNEYAVLKNGSPFITTPRKEKQSTNPVSLFLPKERIIPIFEVLNTVNKLAGFADCFEHHQIKHVKKIPSPNLIIAGVTGLGCNHGVRRIAKMSRNINQNELEYAVNWHFTVDNLIRSNDRVIELMEKLQLPKLYKRWNSETHTSSDGQKYNIGVESLNANYSFKYFGKGKGVTVYVFLDEHNRFPYSVVISSSESEAHYVIDGLMHNDVVQSTIHSTDTAGYSEIIFGVCHLIGISFAPRIKNFSDQQLYSFENRSKYTSLGYKILPSGKINIKIIHDNWDDILRFIATIKLRETSASQLFRRLSSYTRQHRLFKALKEFGKIIKTLFLLKYIDDIELRQAIEKQLNKQENSNKLGKAVFHGNNQEFQQSTKEDQMIAEGCKRLIENSIVCWNYLYLSKMIHEAKSIEERNNIIEAVKNGSVLAWQHFNMQGDYDFSDDYLKDAIEFSIDDLLQLKVA
ncbi:MAG: Tn3 transposase DDE domain protein [Syntrophorhabdus sp. PtaU1.Bin050]|nr:MAG: Tn3 transposase DDE domain protein [Syntrophorhabdus sp. PtaU1.Bin050]